MAALQRPVPCEALVLLLLPLTLRCHDSGAAPLPVRGGGTLLPVDAIVDPTVGRTMLHCAVLRGMPLTDAGADPNVKVCVAQSHWMYRGRAFASVCFTHQLTKCFSWLALPVNCSPSEGH